MKKIKCCYGCNEIDRPRIIENNSASYEHKKVHTVEISSGSVGHEIQLNHYVVITAKRRYTIIHFRCDNCMKIKCEDYDLRFDCQRCGCNRCGDWDPSL